MLRNVMKDLMILLRVRVEAYYLFKDFSYQERFYLKWHISCCYECWFCAKPFRGSLLRNTLLRHFVSNKFTH